MRIAINTSAYQYWLKVHPDNLVKGKATQMGGSETAALSIAEALAARGHDVLLGCKVSYPETFGNLRICPLDLFPTTVFSGQFDVLVSWDDPHLFRIALPHIPVKVLCFQLNDVQLGVIQHVVDLYFHPSEWHRARFTEEFGVPEAGQVVGLTNGTDPRLFMDWTARHQRVIWASSPDRGLHHLLRMWPRVIEQVPEAELHLYYDMDRWLENINTAMTQGHRPLTTDYALQVRKLLPASPNTTYHGGVGRLELAAALMQGKVLAYPCDPVAPTEGFSMTTLEAWIAGCTVILSDADALQELWGEREGITCLPLPIDDDLWVSRIITALAKEVPDCPRLVPPELTWEYIAGKWEEAFEQAIAVA